MENVQIAERLIEVADLWTWRESPPGKAKELWEDLDIEIPRSLEVDIP